MKNKILVGSLLCLISHSTVFADTILMRGNRTMTGTVIQTNGDEILILTRHAAFNFSTTSIQGIKPGSAEVSDAQGRLPDFQTTVLLLTRQSWATNLTPIPSTVIDKGILRNVPYASFHCGEDYEVNIYGDLDHPAGIEVGIYRKLLDNGSAKTNCLNLLANLLNQTGDQQTLQGLDLVKDLKKRSDLTFEITPPTDEDAYGGWWVSVYSEKELSLARASDQEMDQISVAKTDAVSAANKSDSADTWTADDLKRSRSSGDGTISFVTSSGIRVTNAEVVRVIDGVSLIYRNGPTSGGMVKLADLPEELRIRFGYDAAKTAAADEKSQADKTRWQQQANAAIAAQAAVSQNDDYAAYSGGGYSGGGRVYVHGYTRKDGTYVHSYTRR